MSESSGASATTAMSAEVAVVGDDAADSPVPVPESASAFVVARRAFLGAAALGAGLAFLGHSARPDGSLVPGPAAPSVPSGAALSARPGMIAEENAKRGDRGWQIGDKPASDRIGQIKGYATEAGIPPGGRLRLKVSVDRDQPFSVEIYRLGYYGGSAGRLMARADGIPGKRQEPAYQDPQSGAVVCAWEDTWETEIPHDWPGGAYFAVLTNAEGFRNYVQFTVTEPERAGDFLVVLPVMTCQAYNQYPIDGRTGRSLYYGQNPSTGKASADLKARAVSFDRPYSGAGFPHAFELNHSFIRWAEQRGYDLVYATDFDLHHGRVDPGRHRALIFPGHDEYWSWQMRTTLERALVAGVHAAFLAANNIYWHVRIRPSADGAADRVVFCNKSAEWSTDSAAPGPTVLWRDLHRPEQELLGIQYVSVVDGSHPLVVREASHWFWEGTGLRDGDTLADMVSGEADRRHGRAATPRGESVFLAESPYRDPRGARQQQQSVLHRNESGGLVFTAGTFRWSQALGNPRFEEPRVQRATENLFRRFLVD
ncbi:MAG TPA: N,N-dimethylformamidase beta subunit family domain-containing protein [Yinghuangia sp.]|nr:N,N-dimethylformamidase beta subunit family domain-containing protein [Yinghuangia sp.]